MNAEPEIRRLLDMMPASGRMHSKIVARPQQAEVITYRIPFPWGDRPIAINFALWSRIPRPERDLLILRAVAWLKASNWLKPELYQGIFIAGLAGGAVQLSQGDALGVLVGGGLSAIAAVQIWRNHHGVRIDLDADTEAVRVAQRRGYSETEAAQHLLRAIQTVAELENRSSLDFVELIRTQNLRAIAGLSPETIPETLR